MPLMQTFSDQSRQRFAASFKILVIACLAGPPVMAVFQKANPFHVLAFGFGLIPSFVSAVIFIVLLAGTSRVALFNSLSENLVGRAFMLIVCGALAGELGLTGLMLMINLSSPYGEFPPVDFDIMLLQATQIGMMFGLLCWKPAASFFPKLDFGNYRDNNYS